MPTAPTSPQSMHRSSRPSRSPGKRSERLIKIASVVLALQLRFFRGQGRRCGDLPKVAVELPRSPDLLTVAAAQNARERQSQSTNELNATVVLTLQLQF